MRPWFPVSPISICRGFATPGLRYFGILIFRRFGDVCFRSCEDSGSRGIVLWASRSRAFAYPLLAPVFRDADSKTFRDFGPCPPGACSPSPHAPWFRDFGVLGSREIDPAHRNIAVSGSGFSGFLYFGISAHRAFEIPWDAGVSPFRGPAISRFRDYRILTPRRVLYLPRNLADSYSRLATKEVHFRGEMGYPGPPLKFWKIAGSPPLSEETLLRRLIAARNSPFRNLLALLLPWGGFGAEFDRSLSPSSYRKGPFFGTDGFSMIFVEYWENLGQSATV